MSAVIPVRNGERYITDAIESVLGQTYERLECIVVDDGSTDGTGALVSGFPDVRYLHQLNRGVAASRNRGIEESCGELIAFLDADDLWLSNKIELQVEVIHRRPELGLVYTGLRVVDGDLKPLYEMAAPPPGEALRNSLLLRPPIISIAQTGLVPRTVIDQLGGFDERLSTSADTDLAWRIALGYPVDAVHEPLALYRQHEGQMHHGVDVMEHDMRLIFEKAFGPGSTLAADRRIAHANLNLILGLSRIRAGKATGGWDIAKSIGWHPAAVARYFKERIHKGAD